MDISNYQMIDYRDWILGDEARKGVNIKRLGVLKPEELRLLDAFVPYQDQRDDPGQGEFVTLHAIKLLDFVPGAIREVVASAAEAHDIGFYGFDPDAWKRTVVKSGGNPSILTSVEIRMPHQIKGRRMALSIFKKVGYPPEKYHYEIADIIGDHDTRLHPTTINGRIVRAADYTWRVSLPCLRIYEDVMIKKEKDRVKKVQEQGQAAIMRPLELLFLESAEKDALEGKPPYNLEHPEYEIACLEFANTMLFKFGEDKARKVLLPKYKAELERVVEFYKK